MDLTGSGLDVILARDTNLFELSGKHVLISQVMVPSFAWNRERDREIRAAITRMMATSGSDIALVLFTSVFENGSDLYGEGEHELVRPLFGESIPVRLDGVISRKKDFLPWLGACLREVARS